MKVTEGIKLVVVAVLAFVAVPSTSFAGSNDPQVLQQDLADLHGDIAAISTRYSGLVPPGLAKRARQAERAVWTLSTEDLALLSKILTAAPNWRKTPALLESALKTEDAQLATVNAAPPSCPAGLPNGILDWFIARDVAQGLDFLQIFAPDDLVVVGLGEGGTISAHPIKIALQVAFESAQIAALVLEQIYFINDECETDAHRALLRLLDDKLDAHDEDVKQLFKTVKAAQRQILRLLLTPQGRRRIDPDVLTCTGDDCPQVIACPGNECKFPIKPGRRSGHRPGRRN